MNWLQKTTQQWTETHSDYDIANHLHAAFSAVLPSTDGKSWEATTDVFYIPSNTYRFNEGKSGFLDFGGFFFMHRDRLYRLDVIITMGADAVSYMKQNGFRGTLNLSYDREHGITANQELGKAEADNPKDFIDQVIAMIQADGLDDRNDGDEPGDLFPQWPYSETDFTNESEDELSRIVAPRVRGYA